MKIGIIQTDTLPEDFQERFSGISAIFKTLLQDRDFSFQVFETQDGQYPASLFDFDAYILPGSRESVNSGAAIVSDHLSWIRELHRSQRPLLAICYGHQAVAVALGGKVAPGSDWEIGLIEIKKCNPAPDLDRAPAMLRIPSLHYDQVVELPPNAQLLATNDLCKVQAFSTGNMLCFQGHIEFSNELLAYFLQSPFNSFSAAQKASALATITDTNQGLLAGQLARDFLIRRCRG